MINDYGHIRIGEDKLLRIGIGTGAHFSSYTWGEQLKKTSIAAIEEALEYGIRFIDTGETYGKGEAEENLAEAIKGKRDKAFIATKVSENSLERGDIEKACDDSLKRLNTDYIDLYQVHWLSSRIPIDDTINKLIKLKEKGKVRYLGICNCGKVDQGKFPKEFISNQLPYSLIWRGIEYDALRESRLKKDVYIFYYCLGQGLLSGKYKDLNEFPVSRKRTRLFNYLHTDAKHKEDGFDYELSMFLEEFYNICKKYNVNQAYSAIGWILSRIQNTITLVGLRNPEQVRFISKIELLNKDLLTELTNTSNKLKDAIGYKLDLWDSNERIK